MTKRQIALILVFVLVVLVTRMLGLWPEWAIRGELLVKAALR